MVLDSKPSSLKSIPPTQLRKRTCYKCHNKGHIASCCTFKQVEKSGEEPHEVKLTSKSGNGELKTGNKQKKSGKKQQEWVTKNETRVGKCKNEILHTQRKHLKHHYETSCSKQFDRPRSKSPRSDNSNGKSN